MAVITFEVKSLSKLVDRLIQEFGVKSPVRKVNHLPEAISIDLFGHSTDNYQVLILYDDGKALLVGHNKDRSYIDASYLTETHDATLFSNKQPRAYARWHKPDLGERSLERTANYEEMLRYLAIPSFVDKIKGDFTTEAEVSEEKLRAYVRDRFFDISYPSGNLLIPLITGAGTDKTTEIKEPYGRFPVDNPVQTFILKHTSSG